MIPIMQYFTVQMSFSVSKKNALKFTHYMCYYLRLIEALRYKFVGEICNLIIEKRGIISMEIYTSFFQISSIA
jgi:hypothetical protein